MESYLCIKCKEEWEFYPEDYEWDEENYPEKCPLCSMPITQMMREVWQKEGILEVVKRICVRFFA